MKSISILRAVSLTPMQENTRTYVANRGYGGGQSPQYISSRTYVVKGQPQN